MVRELLPAEVVEEDGVVKAAEDVVLEAEEVVEMVGVVVVVAPTSSIPFWIVNCADWSVPAVMLPSTVFVDVTVPFCTTVYVRV